MRIIVGFALCWASVFSGVRSWGSGQPAGATDPSRLPNGCVRRLGEMRLINVGCARTAVFTPDGKSLLVGTWDGAVRVWDVPTGRELRRFPVHDGFLTRLIPLAGGDTFLSSDSEGAVRMLQASTGRILKNVPCPARVDNLVLAPNGNLLAGNIRGGLYDSGAALFVLDLATGRELVRKKGAGRVVGFTADSARVLHTFYVDRIWIIGVTNATSGELVAKVPTKQGFPSASALSPRGRYLLLGSWHEPLSLFDIPAARSRTAVDARHEPTLSVAFAPNGKTFAARTSAGTIEIRETATLQERRRFQSADKGRLPLAFSPDGALLASGSMDSTVLLWDVAGIRIGANGKTRPNAEELEASWLDLASADGARAYRAMGRVLAAPASALAYLQKQLPPAVVKVDPIAINRLVDDLESDQFSVRRKAADELAKLGEPGESFFRQALAKNPRLEIRRRLEQLLRKIDDQRFQPSPEGLRVMRAVEIVETIGTTEAEHLLQAWSSGTPGLLLTREATEALEQLSRRGQRAKPAELR